MLKPGQQTVVLSASKHKKPQPVNAGWGFLILNELDGLTQESGRQASLGSLIFTLALPTGTVGDRGALSNASSISPMLHQTNNLLICRRPIPNSKPHPSTTVPATVCDGSGTDAVWMVTVSVAPPLIRLCPGSLAIKLK
jgi:hypothetical protein